MSPTRDQADAVRNIKGSLFNPYPNVGGSLEDICNAAKYISNNTKTYIGAHEAKSFSFISEHIYNRHPIIACVGYYDDAGTRTGGHAILVMGWDTSTGVQQIKYFDPGIGTYVICPYAGFCDGSFNGSKYDKTSYHS